MRHSGVVGSVGQAIGSGGQGTVYVCDIAGRKLALKWYAANTVQADETLAVRIERLVGMGPPDHRFVWPMDLADIAGRSEFGYVMPLISSDRAPLSDLLAPPRRLDMGLRARAIACFEIARGFLNLHARGLCYQDLNFGAFFVDPARGSILICDNDNIAPEGQIGGVYGTPRFMAPEVVRREAFPSTNTDLFSMAVLFFYVICNWHPLDGGSGAPNPRGAENERRIYGTDPCFIFNPADASATAHRLDDCVVARWRSLPTNLRALFQRSFTAGLSDARNGRIVETEWLAAMAHLCDAIAPCPNCAFEIPLNAAPDEPNAPSCPSCRNAVPRPVRMAMDRTLVPLRPADVLYAHHIDPAVMLDFETSVGVVVPNPKDPGIIGLRNLMATPWSGRIDQGADIPIAPGKTIRLVDGLSIDFRTRVGRVLAADPS